MSPIDDELRAVLHGRAVVLVPSPDPLAGIERRARRMRRNRAAAAVAGSALAVAAIALAVPTLLPEAAPRLQTPAASTAPSPVPSPATAPAAYDRDAPWAYRGGPALDPQDLATFTREWATTMGVGADEVVFTPLYGEVHEPSARFRFVYVAYVEATETMEYGLAMSSEAGPQFLSRNALDRDTAALVVPVPGDGEFLSLLVVAAPGTKALQYAPDGTSFRAMTVKAPGVGIDAVDGDGALDRVRVLGADGREVFTGPVPEFSDRGEASVSGRPQNLLDWGVRGAQDDALVERAVAGFAAAKRVAPQQLEHQVLFVGGNDPGQAYVVLQGWVQGQRAQVFGWVETPGREAEGQLRPYTEADTVAVAVLLTGVPGRTTGELVVVVRPGPSRLAYGAKSNDDLSVVEPAPGLDGVYLIDREPRNELVDHLLLDDPSSSRQLYSGPVSSLLCGEKSCG
jgi:hypothetical protein